MGCPICKTGHATVKTTGRNGVNTIACAQCGDFQITWEAEVNARNIEQSWKVSAWIRENLQTGVLDTAILDMAVEVRVPTLEQRALRMLRYLATRYPMGRTFNYGEWRVSSSPGDSAQMVASPLKSIGWCKDLSEEEYLYNNVLRDQFKWITLASPHQLTPKALSTLELVPNSEKVTGFVAMWFNPELLFFYEQVIYWAIRQSGYEPLRIDRKPHNGKIDDEIVASIKGARFVVADFTDHRGGVYYEAGFAHGLGLPVIFMCRNDHLKELHFDIRQYNCIVWDPKKLEEARIDLKNRILATLGQGPLKLQ